MSASLSSARVLIVDDHEAVRRALRRLLIAEKWDVCGEAVDGEEAIESARRLLPDVIIMDLLLPGLSGIETAREILVDMPAIAIVLMTTPDPDIVEAARDAGILGIVPKGAGNFVDSVRAILEKPSTRA